MSTSTRWPRSRSLDVTPRWPYACTPISRSQSYAARPATRAARTARAVRAVGAARTTRPALARGRRRGGMGRLPGLERLELREGPLEALDRAGERDPEITFARAPEADARRQEHAGLLEDPGREVHRRLAGGNAPPEVERAARRAYLATHPAERLKREIAPLLVDRAERGTMGWERREPPRGSELDRLRRARVDVRLEADQRLDERGRAHDEADAPSGHVEGLGEGVKLDRMRARGRDLEDGMRRVVVIEIGVRRVADDQEPTPHRPIREKTVEL